MREEHLAHVWIKGFGGIANSKADALKGGSGSGGIILTPAVKQIRILAVLFLATITSPTIHRAHHRRRAL